MKEPVAEGSAAGQKKRSANITKQLLPAYQSKSSAVPLISAGAQGVREKVRGWRSAQCSGMRNDPHQHLYTNNPICRRLAGNTTALVRAIRRSSKVRP
jgi:hypothetical protein